MPLSRRLISRERISTRRGSAWGSFIWGDGRWGAADQDRVVDVESSPVALSRFGLQSEGGAVSGRPWGTFVWGQDGWGIQAVTSAITSSAEPVGRVVNRSHVTRLPLRLRTLEPQGDHWGSFIWGQGSWGVVEHETVIERESVGLVPAAVKGS